MNSATEPPAITSASPRPRRRQWRVFVVKRSAISWISAAAFFGSLAVTSSMWHIGHSVVGGLLSATGWVLIGACVAGRAWSGSYIDGFKTKVLQTEGPYSLCRNPLYLFSFVGGLGVMCSTQTLVYPTLFTCAFLLYYRIVILAEERRLSAVHGTCFDDYRSRVPRFWPRFGEYSEPKSYLICAAEFRRELGDTIWFIVTGGLVEFITRMHGTGYLPTLIHLP